MDLIWWKSETCLSFKPSCQVISIDGPVSIVIDFLPQVKSLIFGHENHIVVEVLISFYLGNLTLEIKN